jgi:putative membrane protein
MASNLHSMCLLAAIVAVGTAVSAQAPQEQAPQETVADEVFVAQVMRNGRAQIELAKIALTKSERPDVKLFAQRMVDDHTKTNAELAFLAGIKKIILPAENPQEVKTPLDTLDGLTGEAFDRAYIKRIVSDHQLAVDTFTAHADKGTDPALKAWVAKTLPVLQHHLEMAREVEKKAS